MNVTKNIKQTIFPYLIRVFVFICFVSACLGAVFPVQSVFAACSGDEAIDNQCVVSNCSSTPLGNTGNCATVIQNCANASLGSITDFGTLGSNTVASCSNALKSCYASESDTSACNNDGVLARITECNNGDVNADGDAGSHCGVDNAIDDNNAATGGKDFTTNKGLEQQRQTNAENACNNGKDENGQALTIQAIQQCKTNADNDFQSCYSQLGGTATQVTDASYNQCMQGKAANQTDCTSRGGTWTAPNAGDINTPSTAGKCTPSASTQQQTQTCADGSTADSNGNCADGTNVNNAAGVGGTAAAPSGTCGSARVNIISCSSNDHGAAAINDILKIVVSVLSVLVGIAAVGGLAWASIKYAQAGDNQGTVAEAKTLIQDIIIGILLYGFLIAIVNWLVPGGVFS